MAPPSLEEQVTQNTQTLADHSKQLDELRKGQGDIVQRVDQVRAIFGLNGDTSTQAAVDIWKELRIVVTERDQAQERHNAYGLVWQDVKQRLSPLRHVGGWARILGGAILGAIGWKIASGIQIPHLP